MKKGNKKAKLTLKLADDYDKLISTILIGNNIVNILFLDEISAAPQSVQAAAYQITLDRVVGEHKLQVRT